jgi:hypothetical protein
MTLSYATFIGRITPEQLVQKSDAWCEGFVVGATEAALRKPPAEVKQAMQRRTLGMPYRTHTMHNALIKQGHGVTPGNWMHALAAKRVLQQVGYA